MLDDHLTTPLSFPDTGVSNDDACIRFISGAVRTFCASNLETLSSQRNMVCSSKKSIKMRGGGSLQNFKIAGERDDAVLMFRWKASVCRSMAW